MRASVFEQGREGQDQHQNAPTGEVDDVAALLRAHGGEYARLLRQRRPGTRADGSGWRYHANATAQTAGDDPEVHQVLIDINVAAQHLSTNDALRAYATSKRRRVDGLLATAFLDGMLDRVERFPHDVLRMDR